jgi:formylglycine-generating enzyme required for sulfatase activity
MTELEFEKASRGTTTPVTGEPASGSVCFAGTPDLMPASGTTNDGAFDELSANSTANAVYGNQLGLQGPLRAGALATSSSTRVSAGVSFYGILDLSGNVSEQVVTLANPTGRGFTAVHGNGALDVNGNANVSNWPGTVSGAVTGATGAGRRGGSWEDVVARLVVSDRTLVNSGVSTRDRNTGFRCARSLPATAAE